MENELLKLVESSAYINLLFAYKPTTLKIPVISKTINKPGQRHTLRLPQQTDSKINQTPHTSSAINYKLLRRMKIIPLGPDACDLHNSLELLILPIVALIPTSTIIR